MGEITSFAAVVVLFILSFASSPRLSRSQRDLARVCVHADGSGVPQMPDGKTIHTQMPVGVSRLHSRTAVEPVDLSLIQL